MNIYEKHMLFALCLSTGLVMLNIYAVTTGMTDGYYSQITAWLEPLFRA